MNSIQRIVFLPVMLAFQCGLVLIFALSCLHAVWQWLTGQAK